jgi:hypothetical protein
MGEINSSLLRKSILCQYFITLLGLAVSMADIDQFNQGVNDERPPWKRFAISVGNLPTHHADRSTAVQHQCDR